MTSFAEIARKVAEEHPDVADYNRLSDEMMSQITGQERDLLRRLLPSYMRAVLTRSAKGGDEKDWDDFLTERLATPGRGTIFIADATADEMQAAVKRRESFSGNLDRAARRLQRIEKAMREAGATTVKDLSADEGSSVLHGIDTAIALERSRRMKNESIARTADSLRKAIALVQSWLDARETPTLATLRKTRSELDDTFEEAVYRSRHQQIIAEILEEMASGA